MTCRGAACFSNLRNFFQVKQKLILCPLLEQQPAQGILPAKDRPDSALFVACRSAFVHDHVDRRNLVVAEGADINVLHIMRKFFRDIFIKLILRAKGHSAAGAEEKGQNEDAEHGVTYLAKEMRQG